MMKVWQNGLLKSQEQSKEDWKMEALQEDMRNKKKEHKNLSSSLIC